MSALKQDYEKGVFGYMNPVILIISLVLVAIIVFVAVMLIRNILAPKKIGSIKKLIKDGKYQAMVEHEK